MRVFIYLAMLFALVGVGACAPRPQKASFVTIETDRSVESQWNGMVLDDCAESEAKLQEIATRRRRIRSGHDTSQIQTLPPICSPSATQTQTAAPIVVEIDKSGTVVWNGRAVSDRMELERKLREAAGQHPQPVLRLQPNRSASYEKVADFLSLCQQVGFSRLGFLGNVSAQ